MAATQSTPSQRGHSAHMPSDVTPDLSFFDRFATRSAHFASRAWFFSACLLLVIIWAPSYFVIGSLDTWQLIINTATTIITFLLVALLQNTQTRNDQATQDKLNAVTEGLATLMTSVADVHDRGELHDAVAELRAAVGVEESESA
jgi:Low affinity iron permease